MPLRNEPRKSLKIMEGVRFVPSGSQHVLSTCKVARAVFRQAGHFTGAPFRYLLFQEKCYRLHPKFLPYATVSFYDFFMKRNTYCLNEQSPVVPRVVSPGFFHFAQSSIPT